MTTIRIKPRKGIVLAGIPAAGADVDAALARGMARRRPCDGRQACTGTRGHIGPDRACTPGCNPRE
jgi:hypothetical protein